MPGEAWLGKIMDAVFQRKRRSVIGVLAFEISGSMSILLHIWRSSSEESVARIRCESIRLEGVRRIVSDDDEFLLGLAFAEMVENLRSVARSVAWISRKCEDFSLRSFDDAFDRFADSGYDQYLWILDSKEAQSMITKMERYVAATAALHREMGEVTLLENELKKLAQSKERDSGIKERKLTVLQQTIIWKKQEVKSLKGKSLWCKSFESVMSFLVRCVFTTLARIKLAFGLGGQSLPRSASASLIYPCGNDSESDLSMKMHPNDRLQGSFFELNSMNLKPQPGTLGATALSLHYANLIITIEKLIRSSTVSKPIARDSLYAMLPIRIRLALRARLIGSRHSSGNQVLVAEWRNALHKILVWLSPLAHNMISWHSERSIVHRHPVPKTDVLLLQTLCFANQESTEAAITELLVGLNCIWRFEKQGNTKLQASACFC